MQIKGSRREERKKEEIINKGPSLSLFKDELHLLYGVEVCKTA